MSIPDAITVSGLRKTFGSLEAVSDISFNVHKGEVFGFLGPNGAGKTTTINMLIGLARPSQGDIYIGGIDCSQHTSAVQRLIGIVGDESNLYPELTGYDNLCFCGALYGLRKREREDRARELLDAFDLAKAGGRKFGGYSKGMKRRLTIAAGMIHRPEILFLDEPTTGIDVASARHIRQLLGELHQQGTTIFLTTHYIEEAERLCERIAFIVSGRIVRIDTVEQLLQSVMDRYILDIYCATPFTARQSGLAEAFPKKQFRQLSSDLIRVESGSAIKVGPLVQFLAERGCEVVEARRMRPSLEDVFANVTGLNAMPLPMDTRKKEE